MKNKQYRLDKLILFLVLGNKLLIMKNLRYFYLGLSLPQTSIIPLKKYI